MSTLTKCPSCGVDIKIPANYKYTKARCPSCQAVISIGIAVPKPAKNPSTKSEIAREVGQNTLVAKRRGFPLWTLALIIPGVVLFCCGVSVGLLWGVLSRSGKGVEGAVEQMVVGGPKLPAIEIDPAIQNVQFGKWSIMENTDFFGQSGYWLIADATAIQGPVEGSDFQVDEFDPQGRKLDNYGVHLMKLQTNEKSQAQVRLNGVGTVARVVIKPKEKDGMGIGGAPATPAELPTLEIDPAVDPGFDKWRRSTTGADKLFCEVTAGGQGVDIFTFHYDQYDATGKKLDHGRMSCPKLKPGERGEASMWLKKGVTKVVISPR